MKPTLAIPSQARAVPAEREAEIPRLAPDEKEARDAGGPRWPRALRRGPMELVASCLIGAGVLMLLQPFALALYTYSFITTLAGTALFTVVSKFPD